MIKYLILGFSLPPGMNCFDTLSVEMVFILHSRATCAVSMYELQLSAKADGHSLQIDYCL